MVAELMEAEVAAQIGAELGERTPERVAQRNGYRARAWDTRVGELELRIPGLRTGSYFPSFLEPRRRAEQALVAVVQEAYVNGVSTRRVDRLVEQLGIAGMSKDQVSRLCRGLDGAVQRVQPVAERSVGFRVSKATLVAAASLRRLSALARCALVGPLQQAADGRP
jgi:putative transposase